MSNRNWKCASHDWKSSSPSFLIFYYYYFFYHVAVIRSWCQSVHFMLAGVSAQFHRHTVASQTRCAHQARRVNGCGWGWWGWGWGSGGPWNFTTALTEHFPATLTCTHTRRSDNSRTHSRSWVWLLWIGWHRIGWGWIGWHQAIKVFSGKIHIRGATNRVQVGTQCNLNNNQYFIFF